MWTAPLNVSNLTGKGVGRRCPKTIIYSLTPHLGPVTKNLHFFKKKNPALRSYLVGVSLNNMFLSLLWIFQENLLIFEANQPIGASQDSCISVRDHKFKSCHERCFLRGTFFSFFFLLSIDELISESSINISVKINISGLLTIT